MKIIKHGTIKNGVIKGFVFDCEGGPVELDELIQTAKIHSLHRKVSEE